MDFVVTDADGSLRLYQACLSLSNATTKEREVSALVESMSMLKVKTGHIITLDHSEDIKVEAGIVHCIPLWRFLL